LPFDRFPSAGGVRDKYGEIIESNVLLAGVYSPAGSYIGGMNNERKKF
jgi:hypothetical protein